MRGRESRIAVPGVFHVNDAAATQAQLLGTSKYFLFAAIGLMLAYVISHDESFLVHPKDPQWQHYEPFKWWLLPHGIAGACALLLGPMQFSDRLRERFRRVHRVVGRTYVAAYSWRRRSAFTSSTSRSAWAVPDLSALPQRWTPRCG